MASALVESNEMKSSEAKLLPGEQVPSPGDGGLRNLELFWRNHFRWLESIGYRLRRRYEPGWVPSWTGTTKSSFECEDGQALDYARITDAVRIADGTDVALKKIRASEYPHEVDIATYLSSEPLSTDPRNHSVPVYAVIKVPDEEDISLLVMPLLRKYDNPRFDTFGEAVEFFRQMFEGLHFLHEHHIAHRDCWGNNMMMEGWHLYPDGFHPIRKDRKRDYSGQAKHFTRTQRPPKYYLIDFGLSRRFSPDDRDPGARPIMGGDKSVPEMVNYESGTLNPFHTDIYYIGNMVKTDFIMAKCGFEFMELLVADMVQNEPSKRPSMDEVVTRFEDIRKKLSSWKLRSRVCNRGENSLVGFYYSFGHWTRRLGFMVKGVSPLPMAA